MTQDTQQTRAPRSPRSAPPAFAAVLNVSEAAAYIGMRATSFWEARRKPGFPEPVLLTERLKGYRRADLDRWIESRLPRQGRK